MEKVERVEKVVKAGVFVAVAAAAIGVAMHTLLVGGQGSIGVPPTVDEKVAAPGCEEGSGCLADIRKSHPDKDVIFVVLAGPSGGPSKQETEQVAKAVARIEAQGKRAVAVALEQTEAEHAELVRHFSIKSLPSVVVVRREQGEAVMLGEITEKRLLDSVVRAAEAPSSGCCP